MADARGRVAASPWVAAAGFGVFTVNSALAIYRAKGEPASTAFVVAASYLLLLLPLFSYLRAYERAAPGSAARERASRAVWALTTLLTAVFSSRMDRKVAALTMAALGVMTCDAALAVHKARGGGLGAAALVLVAYATLLALIISFLHEFLAGPGRARGVGNGQ